MGGQRERYDGDAEVIRGLAVRTPLPDEDAERVFHENMMNVSRAREQRAELLEDPDVPLLAAYEAEFDRVAKSFERRLRRVAGDDYREVALAFSRGERDDRVGALAAYYFEGLWRIQQRTTVVDSLFFPHILRYPDSFTVNIRFASGYRARESVLYESPEHRRSNWTTNTPRRITRRATTHSGGRRRTSGKRRRLSARSSLPRRRPVRGACVRGHRLRGRAARFDFLVDAETRRTRSQPVLGAGGRADSRRGERGGAADGVGTAARQRSRALRWYRRGGDGGDGTVAADRGREGPAGQSRETLARSSVTTPYFASPTESGIGRPSGSA